MTKQQTIEIILVEDNPDDVELTLRALKKHKLANKVLVAKNGAEALEYIFATGVYADHNIEEYPKVIVLDLKLPKVGGLDVLRKLKSDERTKQIPVVVLTSSQEEPDVIESYRLGVNSYIVKPVEFGKFVDCVSELGFYWLLVNESPY